MRSPDRRTPISAAITDRLGFGCGRLRAGLEERNSRKLINAALECGIRYFDTAPSYGDGASERLLGLELRQVRREVVICTKIGFPRPTGRPAVAAARALLRAAVKPLHRRLGRRAPPGRPPTSESARGRFDAVSLRADVQASLDALQIDHVDCLMLHEPRVTDPSPEVAQALRELVSAGLATRIGVGTGSSIETLPSFGNVAQAALTASLLEVRDPRSLIAHGLFRDLNEDAFERYAAESGLLEAIPALRAHLRSPSGVSALLLNCAILGSRLDRVLWSTSSVPRLRSVLSAATAIHDEARSAWSAEREALFADTLRRYAYGVHAAK